MANLRASLNEIMEIEGAVGAAIVDYDSGVTLGGKGGDTIDMELAGAANTHATLLIQELLHDNDLDEPIEDVLVTLGEQYHLTRFSEKHDTIFTYVILDRAAATLALARRQLVQIEANLTLGDGDEETI
jgi:hypothetical protein